MARPDLLRRIHQLLRKTGLDPQMLNLEVNESIVSASNGGTTAGIIQALGEMGIDVQIDNFGTGSSSLLNLKRFPISGIKIDRAFIQEIDATPESALLVRTVVDLAHQLGMPATAEGVETEQQLNQLRAMGCDSGQGFLFSPARAPEAVTDLLEKRQRGEGLLASVA